MLSLYILILIFAPSGMVIAFYRGRRAGLTEQERTFADQVEAHMRARHRG